jgi:2-polyprenyl-3-methyl-5-hydroxy-6-metoxy-1,4-benzoquinol methylase
MPDVQPYSYLEEVNDGILRSLGRLRVPQGGSVLDAGCGRGALGAVLRQRGWHVVGIERHPEAAGVAQGRLAQVVQADMCDFARVEEELGDVHFDVLIFSDVLEHLADPAGVLRHYLRRLRPGGRLFVSVPNFVVWTNRLRLLAGVVAEHDSGVMDRTHLRTFSFRTARRLVESMGLKVERTNGTPHLVRALLPLIKWLLLPRAARPEALIESPLYRIYRRWVYPPERFVASLWRSLLAFRIIVVGVKPGENEHEH